MKFEDKDYISKRLKQWYEIFDPNTLNEEAKRLEKLVMKVFEIYKKPRINLNGILYDDPENEKILKQLTNLLVPKAWSWDIMSSFRGDLYLILGRFYPLIEYDHVRTNHE